MKTRKAYFWEVHENIPSLSRFQRYLAFYLTEEQIKKLPPTKAYLLSKDN